MMKMLFSADITLTCFLGYADFVKSAVEKSILISGVYEPDTVKLTSVMAKTYEMGKNV